MKAPTFNGFGRAVPAGEVLRWSRRRGEAGSSARIIIIITARTGFLNALTKEPSRRSHSSALPFSLFGETKLVPNGYWRCG
jgi:hypothetical protein